MGPSKTMLLPQEGHRVLCKPLKTFLGLVKKISVFDIFLNIFGKKFNMFGIFCNNKLVKKPICLVKISRYFVKISEFLVKNPEIFVKKLIFFGKIFNIFGKRNKHDVNYKYLLLSLHMKTKVVPHVPRIFF